MGSIIVKLKEMGHGFVLKNFLKTKAQEMGQPNLAKEVKWSMSKKELTIPEKLVAIATRFLSRQKRWKYSFA